MSAADETNESDPCPELAQLDEEFAAAPDHALPDIADGSYTVRVEDLEIATARTSSRTLLKWKLRILGPTFAGRLLWRNNVLATGPSLRWLKQDLHTCGLQLDRLSDLPDHLDQLVGLELSVTQRTNGDRRNVYFNRRLTPDPRARSPRSSKPPF
jgi:hypothetical protein